jgi:hypothetical protein
MNESGDDITGPQDVSMLVDWHSEKGEMHHWLHID